MQTFTFIDLFSGIGGFRLALESLGGKCIGFSEIDKAAIATYKANFSTEEEIEYGNIEKIESLAIADIITAGVPCQPWSIAGKNNGFSDPRGKLWFKTIDLIIKSKPKAFILENVKGLADPRNAKPLEVIMDPLKRAGYKVCHYILSPNHYGLPQDRQRLFLVGIRNDQGEFPLSPFSSSEPHRSRRLHEILLGLEPGGIDACFTFSDIRDGANTVHSWDIAVTTQREKEICLTILKNRRKRIYGGKDGNPMKFSDLAALLPNLRGHELILLVEKDILRIVGDRYDLKNSKASSGLNGVYRIYLPGSTKIGTLTATGSLDFVATKTPSQLTKKSFLDEIYFDGRFRGLTADDYRRLQQFPDNFKMNPSDRVARKQLGNSVSVEVVTAIAQQLIPLLVQP
jgi:DNA (cytosine-5)-methyltransferase 1